MEMDVSQPKRLLIAENSFLYFALHYFKEFFIYPLAPFHFDLYDDLEGLIDRRYKELIWLIFRESAKTSLAKIFIVWCICFKKKWFINYNTFDRENSEQALFDIAVWLQTNPKLVRDFGQLYFEDVEHSKIKTKKRIGNFITTSGIRLEAFSTGQSTRGRVYNNLRPDLFVLDDFETSKTRDSYPRTKQVIDHINEMRAGLGPTGSIIFLGNLITEEGSIAYLIESARQRENVKVRNIPVMTAGVLAWPGKYVMTKAEAEILNKDRSIPIISIEAKIEELTKPVFECEMMNNPASGSDKVFDRQKVEEAILKAQPCGKEVAGFKIWHEYKAGHRYAGGADTAKGVGRDSNASAFIDFTPVPNRLVATFESNTMPPDVFGYELANQGRMYGECLLAPEVNNTGYATVTVLKGAYKGPIFRPVSKDQVDERVSQQLGWETNAATKPEIIYQFKSAFEDGHLEILDIDLLNEMKYYALKDLQALKLEEGMTRHFDKLMAAAIAWAMRNYAKSSIDLTKIVDIPTKPLFKDIGV